MKEYFNVIADEEILKSFFEKVCVYLLNGESYMMCHSSRAKHISEEKRKELGIRGRAEMFHTEIGRKRTDEKFTWENFKSLVSKFEVNKDGYTTLSGKHFPDESLVLYFYLNPCSEAAVAQDTLAHINNINKELIESTIKGSKNGVDNSVWKLASISNHIKSCHAQNPARKVWLDFDVDCHLDETGIGIIKSTTFEFFGDFGVFFVRTTGGMHILVRKELLKFNPNTFTAKLDAELKNYNYIADEIKLNDNCMIPLPGTYQYGNIVTFE